MAAYFSNYFAKKILDAILVDGNVIPKFTNLYAGLFHNSTGTTEANLIANTPINEITDGNYNRQNLIITAGASFDGAVLTGGVMECVSKVDITWSAALAAYSNDVTHIALFDHATSGNVIIVIPVTTTAVDVGQYIEILTGSFKVNL